MITDINSEDRLVQQTFSEHLRDQLGWQSLYTYNTETFGPNGTLGRANEREVVLGRDLRTALARLNPDLPESAREQAVEKLTRVDFARSLIQHNREFYGFIRGGVPVGWRDAKGETQHALARLIDFRIPGNNRFLTVRELKVQGVRVPHYNRRADLVCFVNGLPLVFIELKAVYKNIRAGFDENLTDYLHEHSIAHAFHHNAILVVSNGDQARYGSITSKWEHFVEWKRNGEKDKGRVDAEALLDGMLAKDRLLDLVENFILFDDSRAGGTRKIVARNHQVLGVNNAVASVVHQEELKRQFPPEQRLVAYQVPRERYSIAAESPPEDSAYPIVDTTQPHEAYELPLVKRAHPDLGRLGVFWHTQGSGKSYSMAFFAEKVRRVVPGNFTFLMMTDREDLDDQIWRTFIGCGVSDDKTPRASSGKELQMILRGNHRFVFSLIHKFNQPVTGPYSERDDIIVISDEAHRTQAGKFARNMRLALPNASFIGFTGTPLFKHDELTRRIFGGYISRYDFKRSEEDQSTVKLVYESRGEKLGIARLDLNDRIAAKIEEAELDPDQTALLENLLGKDYEVITADDRLDKLANDFVEHCSTRWETGKSMFVCIDKVTCARMLQRIEPRWQFKLAEVKALIPRKEAELSATSNADERERLAKVLERLRGQARWMDSTIIEIIISEAQNEMRDFHKWDFDIIPHRMVMKTGFQTPDGKRVDVDDAFKDPEHPFRIAIVCAMWLTGFDVECLSTLYIDKPMKAHTLMQAIARANRVYPGKDCGLIVDYNGMLKSLRAALAQYALGDEDEAGDGGDIVAPIEELVQALAQAIEAAENHLNGMHFDPARLTGAKGFTRIQALRDAVDLSAALCGAIVFLRPFHERYSIDAISDFPGKVHANPTPRIGGLAIFAGVLAGALWYDTDIESLGLALVLCGLPAFLGGIGEDLTKKVSTVARLLLTFAGAGVAFFLLDARITTLDMPYSGVLLGLAIPSLLFTMFAVGGYAHATNIVDGLNGLAGCSAIIALAAIGWVANDVGDQPVLLLALAAMGAVAGFLVWNFPRGALFLGDGGSYFLGFLTAELAVLLVFRNSEVSPWFALTALLYPVCETMFSSYRRKLRGQGAMQADGLHLHTLVYKRLVRRNGKGSAGQNALAALYLAVLCALVAGPAAAYWDDTLVLQGIALAFVLFYLVCYWSLVRFRFPHWLSARPSVHNAPYAGASRPRKAD